METILYAVILLLSIWTAVLIFGGRLRRYRTGTRPFRDERKRCNYCGSTDDIVEVTMSLPHFRDKRTGHMIPKPRFQPDEATYVEGTNRLCGECRAQQETLLSS